MREKGGRLRWQTIWFAEVNDTVLGHAGAKKSPALLRGKLLFLDNRRKDTPVWSGLVGVETALWHVERRLRIDV